MNPYLKQKAAPWVTLTVLIGGLLASCVLFFIYQIDNNLKPSNASFNSRDLDAALDRQGY